LQSSSGGPGSPSSTPKGQSTGQSAKGKTPEQTGAGKSAAPSKPSKPADFDEFYEAPRYYWQQREFTDREIEAIMVSSVSLALQSDADHRYRIRRRRERRIPHHASSSLQGAGKGEALNKSSSE
jgi:hypothetical protein